MRRSCLTTTTLHRQLSAGVAHEALQVLELLRIQILRLAELLLGALHRGFGDMLVDLFLGDSVFGQHADAVAVDLCKATADGEPENGRTLSGSAG